MPNSTGALAVEGERDGQYEEHLQRLTEQFKNGIEVADRKHHFHTYQKCFVGTQAVEWLIRSANARDIEDAVRLGNMMMDCGLFSHVTGDHRFKNEGLFYRFAEHEEMRGQKLKKEDGDEFSWVDFLDSSGDATSLQAALPEHDMTNYYPAPLEDVGVTPLDEHNVKLLDNVHPPRWVNPEPDGVYNVVVIGAGAGGLVTAAGSAGVGAKVAIISGHLMGGDCLNVGCVPSKALIRCARTAFEAKNAAEFGITLEGGYSVDFGAVMERMRRLRASISPNDSLERFSKLGVEVFQGFGQFTGRNSISVGGKTLNFRKAVIGSGGTPAVPPIPGLTTVPFLTNESIFNLTELPKRFGVIGAGVIGLEMAQCFARFGSEVTVFVRSRTILDKEDPDAVEILLKRLKDDGIKFLFGVMYNKVSRTPDESATVVTVEVDGREQDVVLDALMVATGRAPNVQGMGLESAGIEYDSRKGVKVNDNLRTSNPNVYAVGDCCTAYKFTHAADFMARLVIRNALFFGKGKFSSLTIPWCTYTEPEIAHVGLYPADMNKRGIEFDTYRRELEEVDRAILDGQTEGFVKIHCKKGTDQILGATIVSQNAGDQISEITVTMASGTGLGALANVIHPYPTQAEAIRQAGDAFNRTRLTPTVKALFRNLMALQR